MRAIAWSLAGALACAGPVALVGCGGGGDGHPPAVEPGDVSLPADAPAAVKRCRELMAKIADPLKLGKELPKARPLADELAIVCDALGEIAAKGYAPPLAEKLGTRGREMAAEARNLAKYLRTGDAAKGLTVLKAIEGLCTRLEGDLPRAAPKEG